MSKIRNRQRFEIFKRDRFRCIYCGHSPPQVILEVDHLIASSKGGGDEETNLVTSCQQCNSGKSNRPLDSLPRQVSESIEERRERLQQLRAMAEITIDENALSTQQYEVISAHWLRLAGQDPMGLEVSRDMEVAIRRFLKKLPISEVIEAVELAFGRIDESGDTWLTFKYFCGVCWKKIRAVPLSEGQAPSSEGYTKAAHEKLTAEAGIAKAGEGAGQ